MTATTTATVTPTVTAVLSKGCYWVDQTGLKHRYQVVSYGGNLDWAVARDLATQLRFNGVVGYLATITYSVEDTCLRDLIYDALPKIDPYGVWVGATDLQQQGVWRWVTGPEAGALVNAGGTEFTWHIGQPNIDNERCVGYMFRNNMIAGNDYPCSGNTGHITLNNAITRYLVEYTTLGNELTP
jgi:hypothetical protein